MNPKPKRCDESTWLGALSNPRVPLIWNRQFFGVHRRDSTYRAERAIPEHLMLLVLDGDCTFEIAGKPIRVEVGQMLWVNPMVTHTLTWHKDLIYQNLRFNVATKRHIFRMESDYCLIDRTHELRSSLDALAAELSLQLPHQEMRLRALLTTLCVDIFRACRIPIDSNRILTQTQRQKIFLYVQKHIKHRIIPSDLAREIGLSADYFSRIFRKNIGTSPRIWLASERVRQAAMTLLESTQSIAEIAYQYGYEDAAQFGKQFKAVMRVSPGVYRKRK